MAATPLGTPTGNMYGYVASNTARSFSYTVAAGSDRVMTIIASGYHDPVTAPSAPTYNGVAATQVLHGNGGSPNFDTVTIWVLVAPATGANTLAWTQPGESIYLLSVCVAQDAHQTTPVGDTDSAGGTGTTASLTLTSATDQLIIGAACRGNATAPTAGADQTSIANGSSGGESARSSYETGAASVVHSYSWTGSTDYFIGAIAIMPSGGTAYTDAGQGTAILVGSGADVLSVSEAGQGTTAATGSGSDALSTTEAGQGTTTAVASGSDAITYTEAGEGLSTATGSGADSWAMVDSGDGVSAFAGSGGDTFTGSDAGEGVAAGVGSGLDTLAATDAGEGLATAAGSGSDVLSMEDAGGATLGLEAGGADTFSGSGTDAGQGTAILEGAGLDTLSVLEAGEGLLIASGAASDAFTFTEAGGATLGASAGGLDVWVMVEAGGGLMVAVGGGADTWGASAVGVPGRLRFPAATGSAPFPESVGTIKTPKSTGTVGG